MATEAIPNLPVFQLCLISRGGLQFLLMCPGDLKLQVVFGPASSVVMVTSSACPTVVVASSVCFAMAVLYSAVGIFSPTYTALVVFLFVVGTISTVCSAVVVICSAMMVSCPVSSALATYSACSAQSTLGPRSVSLPSLASTT